MNIIHRNKTVFIALLILPGLMCGAPSASAPENPKIRQPGVAGSFYPADPKELTQMVDGFLDKASVQPLKGPLIALVSPHAGYPFSGPVAAHSYAQLRGRKFERVVVISPSHFEAFAFSSVYDGDAYSTPLGQVPVDKAFAAQLAKSSRQIRISSQGHGEAQGHWEHALEDELPFLQRGLGSFKLVPIVMGDQRYSASRALGVALAKMIQKGKRAADGTYDTLIVASSDLSHFHPYDDAVMIDHKTLRATEEWDYLNMSNNFGDQIWEACGGGGIVAAMIAAERLGANRTVVLKYANSGDVTGDKSRVVGYGAVALIKDPDAARSSGSEFKVGFREKMALLDIAKKSVETAVREGRLYQCSANGMEALAQERAAFVTLKIRGELRGCIGDIAPRKPLCHMVRDVAAYSALRDSRFRPVTTGELKDLEYEISVLSPLRRVTDWKQINVGRDGLLVRKGDTEGLLLPQVATEFHWDRTTFLNETCVKAGLPEHCWQDEDTDVFQFAAIVFSEGHIAESLTPDEPSLPQSRELPSLSGWGRPPH